MLSTGRALYQEAELTSCWSRPQHEQERLQERSQLSWRLLQSALREEVCPPPTSPDTPTAERRPAGSLRIPSLGLQFWPGLKMYSLPGSPRLGPCSNIKTDLATANANASPPLSQVKKKLKPKPWSLNQRNLTTTVEEQPPTVEQNESAVGACHQQQQLQRSRQNRVESSHHHQCRHLQNWLVVKFWGFSFELIPYLFIYCLNLLFLGEIAARLSWLVVTIHAKLQRTTCLPNFDKTSFCHFATMVATDNHKLRFWWLVIYTNFQ